MHIDSDVKTSKDIEGQTHEKNIYIYIVRKSSIVNNILKTFLNSTFNEVYKSNRIQE